LDLITLAFKFLSAKRYVDSGTPVRFLAEVNRIFREENLRYETDAKGGVHFSVDQQFAATVAATIAGLGDSRYANANAEFDKAMSALSGATVDAKQAVRGVFSAVEAVFKLIYPKAAKLVAADAIKSLQATVQTLYASNPTAQRATSKMIQAFADWVDACHNYRHEEGTEEPAQPPYGACR
jgi:hypothetical protein